MLLEHLDGHPRVEPVAFDAANRLGAPQPLAIDGEADPAQLGQPGLRSPAGPGVARHVRHGPIERPRVAGGRPANGRGLQPGGLGHVVDRRALDHLVLSENRVAQEGDRFARLAIQIVVADHAVPRRRDAGGHGGVAGPGDRGKAADHPPGPRAFAGQSPHGGHVGLRIVEVEVRQPVDAQEHNAPILVRRATGRGRGEQRNEHNGQGDRAANEHEHGKSPDGRNAAGARHSTARDGVRQQTSALCPFPLSRLRARRVLRQRLNGTSRPSVRRAGQSAPATRAARAPRPARRSPKSTTRSPAGPKP